LLRSASAGNAAERASGQREQVADLEELLQIPIEAGRVFRRDAGQRSDMKPATIPN